MSIQPRTPLAYATPTPLRQYDRYRDRVFNRALVAMSVAVFPGVVASVFYVGWSPAYITQLILAFLLGLLAFGERRLGFVLRITAFLVIVWSTDVAATLLHGPAGLGNGLLLLFLLGGIVLMAEAGARALAGVAVLAMAGALYHLASQNYSPRIPVEGSDQLLLGSLGTYYFVVFSAIGAWMVGSLLIASRRALEHTQSALQAAELQAEAGARFKDDFVRNVDHRLRASLSATLEAVEQLELDTALEGEGGATRKALLGRIRQSAEGVLALVDAILDLARTESGQCDPRPRVWPCRERLEEVLRLFDAAAARKGLRVRFESVGSLPEGLYSDDHRLRQVLVNIIGNCVEFTDSGEVALRVAYRRHFLQIEVQDTGSGMITADMEHLFEPYACVGTEHRRLHGSGFGLGLAVTRTLLECLGGEMRSRADPYRGRLFVLEIPVVEVTPATETGAAMGAEIRVGER